MKNILMLLLVSSLLASCNATVSVESDEARSNADENGFDAELAKKLNAYPYGMRMYVMAFLKEGPNRDLDSAAAANLQRKHLDNIGRLAEEGKLSLAGPFAADSNPVRGIYIFNITSLDEAKKLTETDPAIQAGSLVMELRQWYGSSAIQLIYENHKMIAKEDI